MRNIDIAFAMNEFDSFYDIQANNRDRLFTTWLMQRINAAKTYLVLISTERTLDGRINK